MQQGEPIESRRREGISRRIERGEYGRSDTRTIRPAPQPSRRWRLAALSIMAVVVLSLPAGRTAVADPESTGEPSGGAALLPRDVIIPLSTVDEVLPEMTQQISTGPNQTVVGNPTANRAVTYATADGSQRVVISVDEYKSSGEASSSFHKAAEKSKEVPGVSDSETLPSLGDGAFIGVVTQGDETHVGGGALYGDLIVTVTLQGYDGTMENKARVVELLRKQGDAAQISMAATGGPSLLLPAVALLLGSAFLGRTVLRRRSWMDPGH